LNYGLVVALCEAARGKVADFNSQEIASTLNALTRLGVSDKTLVSLLCEAAKGKVAEFNSQGLAITLSALAKFGVSDETLLSFMMPCELNSPIFPLHSMCSQSPAS